MQYGIGNEYENIIQEAVPAKKLPEIEVTEQVMRRIRESEWKAPNNRSRWFSRTGAFTAALTLLFISLTAYAASEWIQIRNAAGEIKVQYAAPDLTREQGYYDKFEHKALKLAKPGELIAYYVKSDKAADDPSAKEKLQFAYKERRITDYDAFLAEMKRTGSPVLPETVAGYPFEYGTVSANIPTDAEIKNSEVYAQTLKELKAKVETSSGTGFAAKVIPWSEAGAVQGKYTLDTAHIEISAVMLRGGKLTQEQEDKAELISVEGRNFVYNDVKKENRSYHYLTWYNEQQDAYYLLSTFGGHALTKEQLVKLAGELFRGGL
ncbi:hypothetical protein [Paenibacillus macerans]|uniref:hypothetical protein n=1 Tax=Paenibacillus macerans TaxID=44252 RepID=UPI002041513C|nr:hypothetical protein [Paenibacillus macerans]MCM3698852.1 hypothetical protein [Paenibacillus macerans]